MKMRVHLKKTTLIFVILTLTNVVMITGIGNGHVKTQQLYIGLRMNGTLLIRLIKV